jgi:hypothetical protein
MNGKRLADFKRLCIDPHNPESKEGVTAELILALEHAVYLLRGEAGIKNVVAFLNEWDKEDTCHTAETVSSEKSS